VTLDASLAEEGIEPAIRIADSRAVGEEALRSEEEMEDIRRLRSELANATPPEAAAALRERLG
jgi:transcription termination factor Rho